jgi:Domain of unknown function (DUF4394)/Carbohydrate binding module (family 6)
MRKPKMKKSFVSMIIATLVLAATLILGLTNKYSASATQTTGVVLPKTNIYALNADNTIFVMAPGATGFTRLARVTQANGNLIGIDFRVADGALYAVTDTGSIYTINLSPTNLGGVTLVSNMTPRFPSGYQSLMDFNPVLNAIRLIGSENKNYAVVNSGGNLNATAVQTSLTYGANDVNAAATPHVAAGSYTNNYVGATVTLFYGIDYDLDTFVTILPAGNPPTGSSATGGGVLTTIGQLVTPTGAPVNVSPTTDFDIYTDSNGNNNLVGVSGRTLFTINLSQITYPPTPGKTQNVIARGITMPDVGGGFIDIAVATAAGAPAPTPTPTPAPTPTPTPTPAPTGSAIYEAENAILGGGSVVARNFPGFTGTGFVDYPDNVASGYTQFSVSQTGTRTFIFRYANGSTVNRPCDITINGVRVDKMYFQPTGSWSTWRTVQTSLNLGALTGNKAVRVTAVTSAGGPNLDSLTIK